MEAITVSVVIRGHGYKLFTASLVPFAGHRYSDWLKWKKTLKYGLVKVTRNLVL